MRVLTGNRLKEHVDFHLRNMPRSRFLLDKVSDYLNGDDIKVCGLYGLRRTGKTVMMLQAIKNLQDWDNCFYITCSEKDSCDDVADLLKDYPKGKFFIDEIKEEHVIVKNENSNRTYDEVNSDKTFLFIKDNFGSSRFGF